MTQEKSCGAVIIKKDKNNQVLYLVEKMGLGHYSMCKGHVEEDETEHETALREIKEETSLDVDFIDNFREEIGYFPYPNIYKTVVYFLAITRDDKEARDDHDDEVEKILFLPYEEALETITFLSDKEVLKKAEIFLSKNKI